MSGEPRCGHCSLARNCAHVGDRRRVCLHVCRLRNMDKVMSFVFFVNLCIVVIEIGRISVVMYVSDHFFVGNCN